MEHKVVPKSLFLCLMSWWFIFPFSHHPSVCVFRFPAPACANPAFLLLCTAGNNGRLTCTLSSGFCVGSYYLSWYQQKPGSPSRFLLYYYSDSISRWDMGSPDTSLAPNMPQQMLGFCFSLGCSQRMRLTITVLQLIAVGAAFISLGVSDNEEVSNKNPWN